MGRTKNSMRNIVFGLGGQLLNILMSFAFRTVLFNTLGDVYLGISGLFTNILMVFSLADLGVGTAIIFALYKPIAEDNKQKIKELMGLYSRAYTIIGFVIIALGLAIMPFLESLCMVQGAETLPPDLKIIFALYVLNTASSYFLAYKGTLITAHQKNYIVTNVVYATSVICYGVQILLMVTTRNYVLTMAVQTGTNILQNVITWIIADRMFPYIKNRKGVKLPKEEKKQIFSNMGSLVFYRMGQVIINGTDSIVISSMVGVVVAGFYSNYVLITTTIKNLMQQVFHAITASVGNLAAVESEEKKYSTFNTIYFGNFWMFGWASVCLWCLFNPFIKLWAGDHRMLETATVILIVLNFYMMGMRNVSNTFRDTMGIFRQGRFIPLMAAVVNVIASILLAGPAGMGLDGVMLGTTICLVGVLVWLEPVILFKHGFKRSPGMYFLKYIIYIAVTAGACYVTNLLCTLVDNGSIWTFIAQMGICLIVPNAIFAVIFMRTKEARALFGMVKGVLGRKLRRKAV